MFSGEGNKTIVYRLYMFNLIRERKRG